jgi:hypothetical protein
MLSEYLVLLKFFQQRQVFANRAAQAAMPAGKTN